MLYRLGLQSRSRIDVLLEEYTNNNNNNGSGAASNASSDASSASINDSSREEGDAAALARIQKLMEEDDFIHETKVQNDKLFHFLVQDANIQQVIRLIVEVPEMPEEDDARNEQFVKRRHRYPQAAFQVLQNYPGVQAKIVSSSNLLQQLFSFLDTSIPERDHNLYLSWIKIMTRLLEQKPEQIFQFIMSRDNDFILQKLFSHITMDKMLDFMLKLFMCDTFDWEQEQSMFQTPLRKFMLRSKTNSNLAMRKKKDSSSPSNDRKSKRSSTDDNSSSSITPPPLTYLSIAEFWLTQNVLERCLALMRPEYDDEIHSIVQTLLTAILKRSINFVQPNKSLSKLNPLARKLISHDFVDTYLKNLMNYENSSVMSCGVEFLFCIVSLSASNQYLPSGLSLSYSKQQHVFSKELQAYWPTALKDCTVLIATHLPSFVNILQNPPKVAPFKVVTTFGVLNPPLGEIRLKVIDFLSMLFLSPFSEVSAQLIQHRVLQVITDLFFEYEFNSLLHNQFLKIISYILSKDDSTLQRSLFQDCKIVERILAAHRLNEEVCSKPKGVRKGYMGHLITISNSIVTTAKSQPSIQEMIKNIDEWQVFVENDLAERNLLQATELGGAHPFSTSDMDDHFKGFDDQMEEDDFHSGNDTIQLNTLPSCAQNDDDMFDSDEDSSDSDDETIIRRRDAHLFSDLSPMEEDDEEAENQTGHEETVDTSSNDQQEENQTQKEEQKGEEDKSPGIYTDLNFWNNANDLTAFNIEL